jgi:hypothetical protein
VEKVTKRGAGAILGICHIAIENDINPFCRIIYGRLGSQPKKVTRETNVCMCENISLIGFLTARYAQVREEREGD